MDFDFNSLFKKKNELVSFGIILHNNFLAKKTTLILEKKQYYVYEGLGALNLHILDLVKNMFFFMIYISIMKIALFVLKLLIIFNFIIKIVFSDR